MKIGSRKFPMYRDHAIAVVVPAYNEEALIGRGIETMPDCVDRIVVVDDDSRDRTTEAVCRCLLPMGERLHLIRHERTRAWVEPSPPATSGAATTGDVAVVMAGDAQMDPADLPALLDPVVSGEVDYAKCKLSTICNG